MRNSEIHGGLDRSAIDALCARKYLKSKSGIFLPDNKIECAGLNGGLESLNSFDQKQVFSSAAVMPTSVCGDVDATQSSSYSGSGTTWANLASSPADGSTQANNDFTMINTPTFTGSAGTSSAYFLLNGSNAFKTKNTFSNQLTLYNSHKSTSKWWMALTFQPASTTTTQCIFGDANASTDDGLEFLFFNSGNLTLFQANGSGTQSNAFVSGGFTVGTNYCVIISVDLTITTNNCRIWKNNRTKTQSSTTWLTLTTNATASYWGLGCAVTGASSNVTFMANNTRYYGFSYGNAFIDDTDAGKIFDVYNARQGRTYA